ncbi:fructose-bisphosphatase class II, partial [Escherichia coli]|nr:fructose-bisphosphatase class II [Escherichia coli]
MGIETVFQHHQGLGPATQVLLHIDTPAALRHAATDHPRQAILAGTFVVGEGVIDEAPRLYLGQKVGSCRGAAVDYAVDPIEGSRM